MAINVSQVMAIRNSVLERNAALQRAAGVGAGGDAAGTRNSVAGFGDAMKNALDQVNGMQQRASSITESYERGETTDIAAVMLARQQASVGFEATLQVRNKLLSAYKDIMSMSV